MQVSPAIEIVTKMLSLFVCNRYNIPLSFPPHIPHISLLDLFKLIKKILMQYSPYYDTYKACITYILNISAYVVNSEFVI